MSEVGSTDVNISLSGFKNLSASCISQNLVKLKQDLISNIYWLSCHPNLTFLWFYSQMFFCKKHLYYLLWKFSAGSSISYSVWLVVRMVAIQSSKLISLLPMSSIFQHGAKREGVPAGSIVNSASTSATPNQHPHHFFYILSSFCISHSALCDF